MASAWYVAETQTRGEAKAQRHLELQGFASFCPRFHKLRRHARRVDHVLMPVFPGYLFVRFDRQRDPWHAINGTLGVKRLVGVQNCRPQSMPEPAMEALISRCSGDVISGLFSTLEPGQLVRMVAGPFANLLAQVEELDDQGRVRVLLDILGKSTLVKVPMAALGPA